MWPGEKVSAPRHIRHNAQRCRCAVNSISKTSKVVIPGGLVGRLLARRLETTLTRYTSQMQIADFHEADLDEVLALNEAAVPHVNSLDREALRWFAANARYFRVAVIGEGLAGFLIGLQPGLEYASPNYQWFCAKHRRFGYVDRVVVSPTARRRGVASQLYDDYAATLRGFVPLMTCEVNIRPANASSMVYHERYGFVQVATQETEGGKKEVALMEKRL